MTEQEQPQISPDRATAGGTRFQTGGRGAKLASFALAVALGAAALSAWQWYAARNAGNALEQELARRLAEADSANREARSLSSDARSSLRDVDARLGQLEARIVETQNQRLALESLYREMSRSRDEWLLADVEQILLIASQQLQLAGNVKAALLALETADSRLARADRPQLTQLRRVIERDIERLRGAPQADVTGIGLKLERLLDSIDKMPLAAQARVAPEPPADQQASGWRAFWRELWQDLARLIRVQRVDGEEPALLAPDQAFFVRENLKLRLLGARLSLLARDGVSFRTDLSSAAASLKRYFDAKSPAVTGALAALEQLSRTDLDGAVPDISASLEAVRNYRLVRERNVQ
ncbi:MAG TPA: uroporphyrinogen-III C-methyltransferase [Burkholderiales bacterium]|nr:uroporphyrinogen-III C-methyltransferase [Burkholderiales bacterium]